MEAELNLALSEIQELLRKVTLSTFSASIKPHSQNFNASSTARKHAITPQKLSSLSF